MTTDFRRLADLEVQGRRVLVRADLNVPLKSGQVGDDSRIRASLPTLRVLLERGAAVLLLSHLGRPYGSEERFRMKPVAEKLQELLGDSVPVRYESADSPAAPEQQEFARGAEPGTVTLLENTRFDSRETENDPEFARILASYGDLFVNDAFGAAHRAHASTVGIARLLPSAAGLLLEAELRALEQLTVDPRRPFHVVIGGAKVSDKLPVLKRLVDLVDELHIGGAMACTFLAARGGRLGRSLVEEDQFETALSLLELAERRNVRVHLPADFICAAAPEAGSRVSLHPASAVPDDLMALDIGPATAGTFNRSLERARTIFWNGPMGVFEIREFSIGTMAVAQSVAANPGFTVIGGGDSVAAINQAGLADSISHVSTGGGASLEFLEGKELPGVAALTGSQA